eukprot:746002-Hanusia_phi.AAC.4
MYLTGKLTAGSTAAPASSMPLWGHEKTVNSNFFLVDLRLQAEMALKDIKGNQTMDMFWNCTNAEVRHSGPGCSEMSDLYAGGGKSADLLQCRTIILLSLLLLLLHHHLLIQSSSSDPPLDHRRCPAIAHFFCSSSPLRFQLISDMQMSCSAPEIRLWALEQYCPPSALLPSLTHAPGPTQT